MGGVTRGKTARRRFIGGGRGPLLHPRLRLRLVTSQGPPYPSRSPRAHPSGRTRTRLASVLPTARLHFFRLKITAMRRYALAVVFGALHVCQAFRTKTSRAWEGAVVKPVTFQSPETPLQAECSGTMGRSYLLGLLKRLPQHLIESFMIVCSTKMTRTVNFCVSKHIAHFRQPV